MPDPVLAIIVIIGICALAGLLIGWRDRHQFSLRWMLLAMLLVFLNDAALTSGYGLIPNLLPPSDWNWQGKLLAIAVTLAIALHPAFEFRRMGFTLAPNREGWRMTAAVAAVTCLLFAGLALAIPNDPVDAETAAFQLTMPGLEEEPFYRGTLLLALKGAFRARRRMLGIDLGWGAVILCALFGLAHALSVTDGSPNIDWMTMGVTALPAFLLVWFRERTGSLLLPVLLHNYANSISLVLWHNGRQTSPLCKSADVDILPALVGRSAPRGRNMIAAMLCLCIFLPTASFAATGSERTHVSELSSLPTKQKTQVLVLAGSHLADMDGITPTHLDQLVDVLVEWRPDVIALERLPAPEVAILRQYESYAEARDAYVGANARLSDAAQAVLKLGDFEASEAMALWSGAPRVLDDAMLVRRMLTAVLAYESETALLYWRLLGGSTRNDWPREITAEMQTQLRQLDKSMNERVSLGVRLAEIVGAPRLWSIDSQLDAVRLSQSAPDLMAGFRQAGGMDAIVKGLPYAEEAHVRDQAIEQGNLLPLYALQNSAAFARDDVKAQMDIFNRLAFNNNAGRTRQALWDERNLRIAANIRRVSAHAPGGKILVIIGAAHKPFLDELLSVALDLRVVQFSELLPAATATVPSVTPILSPTPVQSCSTYSHC